MEDGGDHYYFAQLELHLEAAKASDSKHKVKLFTQ